MTQRRRATGRRYGASKGLAAGDQDDLRPATSQRRRVAGVRPAQATPVRTRSLTQTLGALISGTWVRATPDRPDSTVTDRSWPIVGGSQSSSRDLCCNVPERQRPPLPQRAVRSSSVHLGRAGRESPDGLARLPDARNGGVRAAVGGGVKVAVDKALAVSPPHSHPQSTVGVTAQGRGCRCLRRSTRDRGQISRSRRQHPAGSIRKSSGR